MQWVWAYAHRLYGVGTIVLVANLLGLWIITVPVLGMVGNDLAWRNYHFASYEEFERLQRYWTRLGVWFTLACAVLLIVATVVVMVVLNRYLSTMLDFGATLEP